MTCKACGPIVNEGKWQVQTRSEHSNKAVALVKTKLGTRLAIYEAPIESNKITMAEISHCPFCGHQIGSSLIDQEILNIFGGP